MFTPYKPRHRILRNCWNYQITVTKSKTRIEIKHTKLKTKNKKDMLYMYGNNNNDNDVHSIKEGRFKTSKLGPPYIN